MDLRPVQASVALDAYPDDWILRPLSSAIERLEGGISVNSVDDDVSTNEHDPCILKTSSVGDGRFFPEERKKIAPTDVHRARKNPRADTILISRMNTPLLVGALGYVERDYPSLFLPDRLWEMRARSNVQVSMRWLSYLLNSDRFMSQIRGAASGTSGSMKNITKGSILSLMIPFPSFAEQRAIAEALGDVDALIGALEQLIAKKRDIKQAAMQQLLTGRTRLPEFSGEWRSTRLGHIASCFSGGTPLTSISAYYQGDISWIKSGDLNQGYITEVEGRISQAGLNNSSAQMVEPGTLLIALYGATSGMTAITKIRAAINQAILAIVPHKDDSQFLYFLLLWHKDWLIETYTQGGQPNLSGEIVKGIALQVPELSEQLAISTVLSDMDTEIIALQSRLAKTRDIKQGMMQELLTGRTRLV